MLTAYSAKVQSEFYKKEMEKIARANAKGYLESKSFEDRIIGVIRQGCCYTTLQYSELPKPFDIDYFRQLLEELGYDVVTSKEEKITPIRIYWHNAKETKQEE